MGENRNRRVWIVFPAPAGINRSAWEGFRIQVSVPRASGDKPSTAVTMMRCRECSPRQRG